MPFFCCVKDEKRLRSVNDTYVKGAFLPLAFLTTLIFITGNLIMMPFAYLTAIGQKVKLVLYLRRK